MTDDPLTCHVTGLGTSLTKAQTDAVPDCEEADVSFIIRRWWGAATEKAGPVCVDGRLSQ